MSRPFRFAEHLRHGAIVLLFNLTLWGLQMLGGNVARPGAALVYTQLVGLSIWALIDFGRLLLKPDPDTGWLPMCRVAPLVAVGVVGGFVIGTTLADWLLDTRHWAVLLEKPRRLVLAGASTLFFSLIATYFFTSRGTLRAQREQTARAERDATLARLALLQSQLEPHMLFNTLANLRVLIGLDPARAQAMLDRLIAFLRATLVASRTQAHALAAEFDRLDDYLQLMAVRMGPRLRTRFDLPAELRAQPVPPLLLQPLVENSIQHGLEPQVEGGEVVVAARREGGQLLLSVRDTGAGLSATPASTGMQFGLKQVRERLHTLYGDDASLTLQPLPPEQGGGTLAEIHLPLRDEEPHDDRGTCTDR